MAPGASTISAQQAVEAQRLAAALKHAGSDPFRAVISATRSPITICNARGDDTPLIFVNDSFCELTGYTSDEVVGRNCRFLQGPGTDRAVVAEIHDAIADGRAIERDILNYRKDGSPFWCRLGIAPVFDADQRLTYFFAVQSDVTAERERLALLESSNADLERAQRMSEAQLRVAMAAGGIGVWDVSLPDRVLTAS
ncbi:MAG: PAS domain-containing protein, partial [Sphingomonadaceae bacterium]|nr:PAS domain-containing protein [Sphingomonadaceae bacterium]